MSGDTPTLEHGTQLAGLTFYQPEQNASGKTKKNTAGGVTLRGFGWECDGVPPIMPVVSPI